MINGIDELAITNLDGLDDVDPIRICVAYRLNGKRLGVPPCDATQLANCEPIYDRRAWLEYVYSFGSNFFATSFCSKEIRQIHFRINGSKIVHH